MAESAQGPLGAEVRAGDHPLHLIVEGSLRSRPALHRGLLRLEETMPGFSSGMGNVSKDEQRHIGFGVKSSPNCWPKGRRWEGNRRRVVELHGQEVAPLTGE